LTDPSTAVLVAGVLLADTVNLAVYRFFFRHGQAWWKETLLRKIKRAGLDWTARSTRTMPSSCRFYYQDSHRGSTKKECRLLERTPSTVRWDHRLCKSCPVPGILADNPCANLALEAEVKSRFGLLRKVAVFAVCTLKHQEVDDPRHCGRGCDLFESLR